MVVVAGRFGSDADATLAEFKADIVLFFALGTKPRFGVEFDP